MTDPTQTNVGNDVHGPVQSGSFVGPVQTVHITTPEPPQSTRDQIKDIWVFVAKDSQAREDMQAEHKNLHWQVARRLDRVELMQIIQMVAVLVVILFRAQGWW